MVLTMVMKILVRITLFLIMVFIFSCEKSGFVFIYCPDCQSEEPQKANLDIKLSIPKDPTSAVTVKIYEGNLEDSILYATLLTYSRIVNYWVLMNKKYTVTARYYIPGNTYTAVDAVTPRVRYDEDQCKEPCYYVYNKTVDLRLNYTK